MGLERRRVSSSSKQSGIEVIQVDTLVFFYGGGFDLGGAGTERAFEVMGAARHVTGCHVVVEAAARRPTG
ncbi:hypothetical protein DB30_07675 [Enhygromyxa salina]|uniref:Uncharacterized protein n=1 Tax=Enhygromyxa salina TaxID=215803 RepID=A0A0C2DAZ9_9BACT|nr:hypothetical protein DB30_07675 [Enhygromyxa salina]